MTILDARGRYLADMDEPAPRPAGPWDGNRVALRGRDVREALAGEVPIRRVTFRGQPPTDDEIESTKDARVYIAAEERSELAYRRRQA